MPWEITYETVWPIVQLIAFPLQFVVVAVVGISLAALGLRAFIGAVRG